MIPLYSTIIWTLGHNVRKIIVQSLDDDDQGITTIKDQDGLTYIIHEVNGDHVEFGKFTSSGLPSKQITKGKLILPKVETVTKETIGSPDDILIIGDSRYKIIFRDEDGYLQIEDLKTKMIRTVMLIIGLGETIYLLDKPQAVSLTIVKAITE